MSIMTKVAHSIQSLFDQADALAKKLDLSSESEILPARSFYAVWLPAG